jgi:hypothetical protein
MKTSYFTFLFLFCSIFLFAQKTSQEINATYNGSVQKLYSETYNNSSERAHRIYAGKKDLAREKQRDLAFAAESSVEIKMINKNLQELEDNYKISKKGIEEDPTFSEANKKKALKELKTQYKTNKRSLEKEKLKYTDF